VIGLQVLDGTAVRAERLKAAGTTRQFIPTPVISTLTPITRKVVAAGDLPAATPMGLGRDDLHDDSAHLS
jgi:hypothetical protein